MCLIGPFVGRKEEDPDEIRYCVVSEETITFVDADGLEAALSKIKKSGSKAGGFKKIKKGHSQTPNRPELLRKQEGE